MKMSTTLSFCTLALGLSACQHAIDGTVDVSKAFVANVSITSTKKTVTIPAGHYALNVTTGLQTSRFTLTNSAGQKLVFRTPDIGTIRQDLTDGHAYLRGSEINQAFDVDLTLDVKNTYESGTYSKTESCVLGSHEEERCDQGQRTCYQKSGTDGNEASDFNCTTEAPTCHTETVTDYGSEDVTGYDSTDQRQSVLKIIKDGTTIAVMRDGTEAAVSRFIPTYTGPCR